MEKNQIEAYVKYNYFHKEDRWKFKNDGFLVQNLYYNEEQDYHVCSMGQHMEKTGNTMRQSENRFVSRLSVYKAENCTGCPLKCLCHSAKGNRKIEVNQNLNRHKAGARERLTLEEGLMYCGRRPVELEAVFGQSKSNKGYNRIRHFDEGKPEKAMMDFAIFAIISNVLKLHRKVKNTGGKPSQSGKTPDFFCFLVAFAFSKAGFTKLEGSGKEILASAA